MNLEPVYLKDYRPSCYQIDSIQMRVDIFDDFTIVESMLEIRALENEEKLVLNGENLELLEVTMNDVVLNDYELTSETLTLFPWKQLDQSENKFYLKVKNKIYPHKNKALEGFYQSGPQLCSQCEPEGFRKITYFIDRPDVMSSFRVRMTADFDRYPFLLSNGNKMNSGKLDKGRHFVEWYDPHLKPCYLFAMVAGDFDVVSDQFETQSGKKVDLEIYVDKGNAAKTSHAMKSLKESMKWDEEKFGLEYDLDIYMIVAVDSFNMGAMENKGLNIFNSSYVLADEQTATDQDFQNIQAVIGHEYFHNWTGNRVTCRDWFQLTLKEGLTVFRDQEFSADMLSSAVKRIEDVKVLKEFQFPEDQGPLSHPIRPDHYIEMNNFYTRTVYEKGAEVIRMIQTLIGREKFRKGMDEYFKLYDGKAVTTEDFIYAMERASGKDLNQFKNWYSTSGTPRLDVRFTPFHEDNSFYELTIEQGGHLISSNGDYEDLFLPFKVGFIDQQTGSLLQEQILEIKKKKEIFRIDLKGKKERVIPSLNRSFSAPVLVEYQYSFEELLTLVRHDNDPYARYEAMQMCYQHIIKDQLKNWQKNSNSLKQIPLSFLEAFEAVLYDEKIDLSFKSYLLEIPSENSLFQMLGFVDFDIVQTVRHHIRSELGRNFLSWFMTSHESLGKTLSKEQHFSLSFQSFGKRALRNQCLSYLVATSEGKAVLDTHYQQAKNMTEEVFALEQYVKLEVPFEHEALWSFYHKWKNHSLVMQKWFSALASYSPKEESLSRILTLEKDPVFDREVPNFLRSLYLQFTKNNLVSFHQANGEGYRFIADKIIEIDRFNPQVASRLAGSFSMIERLDKNRQEQMRTHLARILEAKPSKDTFEVVSKLPK